MSGQQRKILGNYEILGKIGQGGMGAVFKAVQLSMKREVALKILPPRLAKSQAFVQRFLREAQSAGAISHPNLIQVYDVGEADGYHFFAMEFVDGTTLKRWLKERGPLDEAVGLDFMLQTATALSIAHGKGIVHRDVKPDNILVTRDGLAKLGDLGLAKPMDGAKDVTMSGQTLGTPAYMSPEQTMGEDVDGRSDLYSLGATFHHLFSGTMLFDAPTSAAIAVRHVNEAPTPIRSLRPELSAALEAILLKLLAKDPAQRYQRADALIADLEALRAGTFRIAANKRSGPRRTVRPARNPGESRRPGLPVALLVGAGLLVLVLGGWLLSRPSGADRGGPETAVPADPVPAPPDPATEVAKTPAPPPTTPDRVDREARARALLAKAGDALASVPQDLATVRGLLEQARDAGRGTVVELEADVALADLDRRRLSAEEEAWSSLDQDVAALVQAGDFDQALQRVTAAKLAPRFAEGRGELLAGIRRAASALFEVPLNEATAAFDAGRLDEIDGILAKLAAITTDVGRGEAEATAQELRQRVAQARQRAVDEAAAAMEALLGEALLQAAEYCAGGDTARLAKQVDALETDRRLRPMRAQVDALRGAATALAARDRRELDAWRSRRGQAVTIVTPGGETSGTVQDVVRGGISVSLPSRTGGDVAMTVPLERIAAAERQAFLRSWRPEDAGGQLLLALAAVHEGDQPRLGQALEQLGGTPLEAWLRQQQAVLAVGRSEHRAERDWRAFSLKLPERQVADAAAGVALLAELDTLAQRHADTRFWTGLGDAPMRARGLLVPGSALDLGLLARWSFDEGRGGVAVDQGPNGLDLALVDNANWSVEGRIGGSLRLDGRSHARAPHTPLLEGLRQFSIACWFRCERPGTLVGKREHWRVPNNMAWHLAVGHERGDPANILRLHCDIAHLNNRRRARHPVEVGVWHHVVLVFDGTAKEQSRLTFHLDGIAIATMDCPADSIPRTEHPVLVGCYPDGEFFVGMIDDLRLYGRALDAAAVAQLFAWRGD